VAQITVFWDVTPYSPLDISHFTIIQWG